MHLFTRLGTIIVFIILVQFFGGCMTYHSPTRLSTSERTTVENADLSHLTVGVVPASEENNAQATALIQNLTRTQLFKEINIVSLLVSTPDLLIKLEPPHRRFYCATGPGSLVIPTLGIIPFNVGHHENVEFTLLSTDQTKIVPFIYTHKGAAWWGSLISVLAISPNWTLHKIDENRHTQHLTLLLALHKNEILSLVKSTRD